eukprot:Tbor_TRINITY_DN9072_c0_g1::TRINITY_DN9072_c0_g1_i1::g.17785::m.17785
MGCGFSSLPSSSYNTPRVIAKYNHSDDDESSLDCSTSSNVFTVHTASRNERIPHSAYTPGNEAAHKDWMKKAIAEKQVEEKLTVEEFVFGDFVVDAEDDWKRKTALERFQLKHRRPSITYGKTDVKAGQASFVINDFQVAMVDEGDELEYFTFNEPKLPQGFRKLRSHSMRSLLGHSSRVKTIAIAPNDIEYASAAIEDSHLTMTSLARDGEETGTFIGHSSPIISATFSRDGRYLATSSRDHTVIVWNMNQKESARKQIRTLEHHTLPICACFSYDSQYLITGCQDRICRVWDIESKEQIGTYEGHQGVVVCAVAIAGQDTVITGGGDRNIRMWSVCSNPETITQFIGHDGVVISVNVTPDGEKLLSNDDRACKMWNLVTGACVLNVTIDSLTQRLKKTEFPPPMPLPNEFIRSVAIPSQNLGYAANGILGPQAVNACKIGNNRAVFTLSCLCPGDLSCSYFAVACTNRVVYIVSCASGVEEISFSVKSSVFAINSGRDNKLLMGDIYGNAYIVELNAEKTREDMLKKGNISSRSFRHSLH